MLRIQRLDHLVLTVRNVTVTSDFYEQVLGSEVRKFEDGRTALHFGNQKINLHLLGEEIQPHAVNPTVGSADLCLIVEATVDEILQHLKQNEVEIELGPVERTGALGRITSVYIRDPDGNLIEISIYGQSPQ